MVQLVINWDICQNCEPCSARLVCHTRAIVKLDGEEPPYIEPSRCNGCAKCIPACTFSAIVLDGHHAK